MANEKKRDDDSTIENRVYVFESLARAFVEKAADDLGSKNPERRTRAMRALADLAFVSCVISDTEELDANAVRRKVLDGIQLEQVHHDAPDEGGDEDEEEDDDR